MIIYLIRHGIAEDHSSTGRDFDRVLTPVGMEKTRMVARNFKKNIEKIDAIFHSPLKRAEQTANIFSAEFKIEPHICEGLEPEDNPHSAIAVFKRKSLEQIIVVGHEPNLSILASNLIQGNSNAFFSFKKAGIAGIEWNGRVGQLLFLLQPKFLV